MLSLNTLRTKFSVLLLVIIGGALLAFILSLKTEMGFSGNDPEVGEVNGEEIHYSEFSAAYNDTQVLMGGENVDYDQSAQIIYQAWESLMMDRVMVPAFEDLGLTVTEAELTKMKRGEVPSAVYSSLFVDPSTGLYSIDALNAFIEQARADANMANVWRLLNKQARLARANGKYMDLVRGGAYANALSVNKGVAGANNSYNGRYVLCNYTSIADSLVVVSDKEIKNYYENHKEKYQQTPYRTVNYAHFEALPTDEDKKAVEAKAKEASEKFAAATDVKGYVREESRASLASTFVAAKSLPEDEAKVLGEGKMFGPELQGDEWYASRVVETRNVPDSIKLQHVVVSYLDTKLADSLYTAAKQSGADFAAIAKAHSIAETAAEGGAIGNVAYSSLSLELADALKNVSKGSIVKVEMGNAIQIFKVLSTGSVTRHYRIASLAYPVEPSEATKVQTLKDASAFAVEAKGSIEKFKEVAAAKSIMTSSMNVERGNRNVPGLSNSLEVVRWANEAKVGDVSELISIDGNYVVAVVTAIDDEEYKALDKVSAQIKNTLVREKKAEMLKAKMQGSSLDEIAVKVEGKIENFADAKSTSHYTQGLGVEPRVFRALASVTAENKGALLPLIDGGRGVYAVVVDEVVAAETPQTVEAERVKAQAEEDQRAMRFAWGAIRESANVVDNTAKFF